MKKSKFITLTILVVCSLLLSVSLFGCKKSDTPESKTTTSSKIDAPVSSDTETTETSAPAPVAGSPEDYFEWDGNTITGLTEKGKSATEITIPKKAEAVGSYAFSADSIGSIKSITFEEGSQLKTIGERAFWICRAITDLTIPKSVEVIGDGAFGSCKKLTNLTFEEGSQLKTIEDSAFFQCTALSGNIVIPKSVESIGEVAFKECPIESITFEAGSQLKLIGASAFHSCLGLTEIFIPKNVETIEYSAFDGCVNVKSLTFEEGSQLKTIDDSAFYGINSTINEMGNVSLSYLDTEQTTIILPEGLTYLDERAIVSGNVKAVYLPASLTEITPYGIYIGNPPNHMATVYVKEGSWADLHFDEFIFPEGGIYPEPGIIKAYY